MKNFSERLVSLRGEREMTQTDVAKIIGKQRSTVSGYETEDKEPDFETLCVLAEHFGVTTDYMLGRDNDRTHADVVFRNDNANFKKHFDALPQELKVVVTGIFDDFYVLLNRDMRNGRAARLALYRELLHNLQTLRAEIRSKIEHARTVTDPRFLSDLMASQNALKAVIATTLDELMQADLDYVLNLAAGGERKTIEVVPPRGKSAEE